MKRNPPNPKTTTNTRTSQATNKKRPTASSVMRPGERDADRIVEKIPRGRVEKNKKGK